MKKLIFYKILLCAITGLFANLIAAQSYVALLPTKAKLIEFNT